MRLITKAIAATAIAAATVVATAGTGHAAMYVFHNPVDGCTYYVWGPDVRISTLPNPDVDVYGGFGEYVSCP